MRCSETIKSCAMFFFLQYNCLYMASIRYRCARMQYAGKQKGVI